MSALRVNRILSQKVIPYALVGAFSSLFTSWALDTPELGHKAATLQAVQETTLPQMSKEAAAAKTALRQAECDKGEMQAALVDSIVSEKSADWSDLDGCHKVKPVKPVPVEKLIPKVDPKS